MPRATCRPKLMRSFTVGFWGHTGVSRQGRSSSTPSGCPSLPTGGPLSTDPLGRADEPEQVPVAHVGQQHLGQPLGGQRDADEGQHIGVVQAAHEQPLPQEGLHLLQLGDACGAARVGRGKAALHEGQMGKWRRRVSSSGSPRELVASRGEDPPSPPPHLRLSDLTAQ